MTEHAWLTSTNLKALLAMAAARVSRRKLLLFGCAVAWWRRAGEGTFEDGALLLAERLADGPADRERLRRQVEEVMAVRSLHEGDPLPVMHRLLGFPPQGDERAMTSALAGLVDLANGAFLGGRRLDRVQSLFEEDLVARLRDLVGNPFRPAGISPEWLACDGRQVTCLARAIYDERRFNELPYVADALEDAGCGDEVILRHLRGPGPHVRGCWVLDLLLGLA